LRDYLRLLRKWKERYAPKSSEEPLDERFSEACRMLARVEGIVDVLAVGSPESHQSIVAQLMKDGKLNRLEERITKLKEANEIGEAKQFDGFSGMAGQ
jgi:hypothetical protein